MGGIGRNFARKCRALDMEIVYHNRKRLADVSLEEGARYVGFEELLGMSDVVSVHVPLNSNTRHLLGKKELGMCKKGVVIVNTARGAVIDEAALVEALESGQVGSVGLDVFEEEPKVHEGLLRNDRVLLLPHMGMLRFDS
jgi:glyoxylate reductase